MSGQGSRLGRTEGRNRLEYLRGEIRAGVVSYGELAELQALVEHIDPGDVELLEWAGVPEYPDGESDKDDRCTVYGAECVCPCHEEGEGA